MNVLVIKQTSLGDVLHSTGHIRTIKENFPQCRLTVLTATGCADIYRHNPWIDEIILFERTRIKREWWRHPMRTYRYLASVIEQVRAQHFELAFDLQGLARSVIFLYAARARKKYVKGRWLGLVQYQSRTRHAIAEMDGVLNRARLSVNDTSMEVFSGAPAHQHIADLLAQINPERKPLLVFSPFSRWQSKDWPLSRYIEIATRLTNEHANEYAIAFTGSADARQRINQALSHAHAHANTHANANSDALPPDAASRPINLAGRLSILQFAELVRHATLMLSGDSFPMHIACAQKIPVVALFGPTDEALTGPVGESHEVIRAPGCVRCDRPRCRRCCLNKLSTESVFQVLCATLARSRS